MWRIWVDWWVCDIFCRWDIQPLFFIVWAVFAASGAYPWSSLVHAVWVWWATWDVIRLVCRGSARALGDLLRCKHARAFGPIICPWNPICKYPDARTERKKAPQKIPHEIVTEWLVCCCWWVGDCKKIKKWQVSMVRCWYSKNCVCVEVGIIMLAIWWGRIKLFVDGEYFWEEEKKRRKWVVEQSVVQMILIHQFHMFLRSINFWIRWKTCCHFMFGGLKEVLMQNTQAAENEFSPHLVLKNLIFVEIGFTNRILIWFASSTPFVEMMWSSVWAWLSQFHCFCKLTKHFFNYFNSSLFKIVNRSSINSKRKKLLILWNTVSV